MDLIIRRGVMRMSKKDGQGCESHFVLVNSLRGVANYDCRQLVGPVHGSDRQKHGRHMRHTVPVPKGSEVEVSLTVAFLRQDLDLSSAVAVAGNFGYQMAVLPEVSILDDTSRDKLDELFRAMRIAAHQRRKDTNCNGLAITSAGTVVDGDLMAVKQLARGEEGYDKYLLLRQVDWRRVVPVTMALPLVPAR